MWVEMAGTSTTDVYGILLRIIKHSYQYLNTRVGKEATATPIPSN